MKRTYIIVDSNIQRFTKCLHDNHITIGGRHKVVGHATINSEHFVSYTLMTANQEWLKSFQEKWNNAKTIRACFDDAYERVLQNR